MEEKVVDCNGSHHVEEQHAGRLDGEGSFTLFVLIVLLGVWRLEMLVNDDLLIFVLVKCMEVYTIMNILPLSIYTSMNHSLLFNPRALAL
jgi:hypothetical protein